MWLSLLLSHKSFICWIWHLLHLFRRLLFSRRPAQILRAPQWTSTADLGNWFVVFTPHILFILDQKLISLLNSRTKTFLLLQKEFRVHGLFYSIVVLLHRLILAEIYIWILLKAFTRNCLVSKLLLLTRHFLLNIIRCFKHLGLLHLHWELFLQSFFHAFDLLVSEMLFDFILNVFVVWDALIQVVVTLTKLALNLRFIKFFVCCDWLGWLIPIGEAGFVFLLLVIDIFLGLNLLIDELSGEIASSPFAWDSFNDFFVAFRKDCFYFVCENWPNFFLAILNENLVYLLLRWLRRQFSLWWSHLFS